MQLEFDFLSRVTDNPVFAQKADKVMDYMVKRPKSNGFYANYINPDSGEWCAGDVSVGALGDSFYEYLLKVWLYRGTGKVENRKDFDDAMRVIREKLTFKSEPSKLTYIAEGHGYGVQHKMGHLVFL